MRKKNTHRSHTQTAKHERISEVRSEKGMKATERSCKMQRQIWETNEGKGGGEKRKKRRLSGKVSPSISVWTQNTQTRERYQIWKGRLTGEQAGREGASVVVQCVNSTSSCPIKSRERERGAQRVTFPGADRLVGVS